MFCDVAQMWLFNRFYVNFMLRMSVCTEVIISISRKVEVSQKQWCRYLIHMGRRLCRAYCPAVTAKGTGSQGKVRVLVLNFLYPSIRIIRVRTAPPVSVRVRVRAGPVLVYCTDCMLAVNSGPMALYLMQWPVSKMRHETGHGLWLLGNFSTLCPLPSSGHMPGTINAK